MRFSFTQIQGRWCFASRILCARLSQFGITIEEHHENTVIRCRDHSVLALRDPHAEVRSQAAWAARTKGDARAVEPLRNALNDPDADVRKQARWRWISAT